MDDLIGGILPILAVAFWLFGGIFNKDNDEEKPAKKGNIPKPTPTPSGNGHREDQVPTQEIEQVPVDPVYTNTYYQRKQEQLDRMKEQMIQTDQITQDGSIHDAIKDDKPRVRKKRSKSKTNISINHNLTKKGLAESVVMAEVLGPPKAVKPYRTVIQARKN